MLKLVLFIGAIFEEDGLTRKGQVFGGYTVLTHLISTVFIPPRNIESQGKGDIGSCQRSCPAEVFRPS